jgi:VanZ family protein
MIQNLFYDIVMFGLDFCILLYLLINLLLFLNFYKKNGYSNLMIEHITVLIILTIAFIGLIIISHGGYYRSLPGLPMAIFSFFITWLALQKYTVMFRSEKYRLSFYWLLPLLVTALIFFLSGGLASWTNTQILVNWLLSLLPFKMTIDPSLLNAYLRKGWHILIYSTLFLVWFRTLLRAIRLRPIGAAAYSLGLCLLVALFDEGHQLMVPGRGGQIHDVALDLGAALIVALIALLCGFVVQGRTLRMPGRF